MPEQPDPERLQQVIAAASVLRTSSPTKIAAYLGNGTTRDSIKRVCRHDRVIAAAEGALKGEAQGITQASAQTARRSTVNAARELEGSEKIRLQLIADAEKWLATPYGKREYAYRLDREGKKTGEPLIPADIQYGLDLARDRGRDDGAGRLLAERARIEREARAEPEADRPPTGARVVLVLPGREEPPPLRVVTDQAKAE